MYTFSRDIKEINISKRIVIVGVILTTIILCLSIKLYFIMIVNNSYALQKKYQQMYKPVKYFEGFDFIGDIYDCNLKKLTNDGIEHKVIILTEIVGSKIIYKNPKYLSILQYICEDQSTTEYEKLVSRIEEQYKGSQEAVVLTVSKKAKGEIVKQNLPGIYVKDQNKKYGDNVGFTVISNFISNSINNDVKNEDSTDMQVFNYISRYTRRTLKIPVDANGKSIPGLSAVDDWKDSSIDNKVHNVVLTIDYNIQKIAEDTINEMNSENGAVSIINLKTGEVLALASKDRNGWERNMITYSGKGYAYNPGSIFKIIVLAAALEDGKFNTNQKFLCTGRSSTGIGCYKSDGHGLIGLEDAFSLSCNVYFIELAKSIGAEKIISMAQRFGFGDKVLNFSKESTGMLYIDKKDINYDIGNIAIGQKDIMVTPIQVCDMISTIANNGIRNKPYLVKELLNTDGTLYKRIDTSHEKIISSQTSKLIQNLLESVVENGTGKSAQIPEGAAGKTGTPQRGYKASNNRYQYEDEWFAGYFPVYDPQYAVSIYIEDSGELNSQKNRAAIIFKNIAEKILLLER